jgi:preprotein translocase subunit SecE
MRRELRRHPVQAKPAKGSNRPVRMPRSGGAARTSPSPAARSRATLPIIPQRIQVWYQEIFTELKKVQWPTWQETRNLTLVVVVVAFAMGIFLGGLDSGFNWIIEHSLLR